MQLMIALALIIITVGLILLLALPQLSRRRVFRPIPAIQRLDTAIGLAVENGTRIHVALGSGAVNQTNFAASLAGLATLERIAQISSISDRPPLATSGNGPLAFLSQSTLRSAYLRSHAIELFEPDRALLAGVTPFSYTAGVLASANSDLVSTHILNGSFGPEISLLVESAHHASAFTLASTDSLSGQAALYASAEEPLLGEELYALPAYLKAGPIHSASLAVQDILRWGIIAALVVGSILKVAGIL